MTNKESSNTADFTNFVPDSDFNKTSKKNDIYSDDAKTEKTPFS